MLFQVSNVDEYFCNPYELVHGAAQLTWLDMLTSVVIFGFDPLDRMVWVSLGITADFINGLKKDKPFFF